MGSSIGNYNLPYLYFLALFSYIEYYDLYLIKLLSIFFDIVLAFASMKLLSKLSDSDNAKLFVFIGVLLLPTVILNGAFWGQCDSIYAAFGILSIWLALDDKPAQSIVCAAVSFAFKLQAIFIMPIFLLFLFSGRIKLRHCLAFPLTYVVLVLPAVLLGRPFLDTLTLYLDQAGTVGSGLNYNSPSIFALLPYGLDLAFLAPLGILSAFVFMLALLLHAFRKRDLIDDKTIVSITLLFSVAIPFFLPHMHDRYFFSADILSFVFAVSLQQYLSLPILCSFASLLGYHAYIRQTFLLPLSVGSICLAAVIYILIADLNYHLQDLADTDLSAFL